MGPDQLAELEEERRFLLRSLTDLEREYEAGDVDRADYEVLRDGYTARAASVMRAIDQGRADLPQRRRRPLGVVAAWVLAVVAIGVLAGWLVARSSGQRLEGQPMTGGAPIDEVASKLAEARAILGTDPLRAAQLYREVTAADPGNAEARTYTAWLLALLADSAETEETALLAVEQSRAGFEAVVVDHPDYADGHCLYAVAAARLYPEPDPELALEHATTCLASNPPAEMRGLVQQFIGSLEEEVGGSSPAPATVEPPAP